jgi:hypothetical protein
MGHRYGLHNKAGFGAGGWTEKSIFKLGQTQEYRTLNLL